MKFVPTVLAALLIAGCQQSQDAGSPEAAGSHTLSAVAAMPIDVSTPDRALKSYWQAKDARRKVEFDWIASQIPELQKLYGKIGFDASKLMTGDVLSSHQERYKPGRDQFAEYSREIVDIKLDTESRATAVVKVRNSTRIPEGIVFSDSDKKRREEGDRLKYILEKESDGWKVAQVVKFSEVNVILKKDPWENVFKPTERGSANVYVNTYVNQFDN